jgi:hypothetical protein
MIFPQQLHDSFCIPKAFKILILEHQQRAIVKKIVSLIKEDLVSCLHIEQFQYIVYDGHVLKPSTVD